MGKGEGEREGGSGLGGQRREKAGKKGDPPPILIIKVGAYVGRWYQCSAWWYGGADCLCGRL